jgi:ABC-type phosphate transport system permease subunit
VPSLAAGLIASIAGWIIDSLVEPFLGMGARIFIGFVVGVYVYVYARNWLVRLKEGR